MKQVQGLLHVVGRAEKKDYYSNLSLHASIRGLKIPTFEQFMDSGPKRTDEIFSEKDDEDITNFALKRIAKGKKGAE